MLSVKRRRMLREAGLDINDISDENIKKIANILGLSFQATKDLLDETLQEDELP